MTLKPETFISRCEAQAASHRGRLQDALGAFQTLRTRKNATRLEHYRQVCPRDTHFTADQTTLLNEAYRLVFITK